MKNELRIAVLMGGVSDERDVSLKSGRAVVNALRLAGHNVIAVDLMDRDLDMLKSIEPDVVFIALHGLFGEDGGVQQILEGMGLPYTGSGPTASYVGMDKVESKRLFVRNAIPTPDYFVVEAEDDLTEVIEKAREMGFPVVCKPSRNGSSCGISIAKDAPEFVGGVCRALDLDEQALVERFIRGRELTVGVLDGIALAPIEIRTEREFFDFEAKYHDESTQYITNVSLLPAVYHRMVEVSERAFHALGCRQMARVDLMYGYDGEMYVLEVNTIPGMTERSLLPKAARMMGIDFVSLCDHLVQAAYAGETADTTFVEEQRTRIRRVG